jgi:hypothetical protein
VARRAGAHLDLIRAKARAHAERTTFSQPSSLFTNIS